MTAAMMEPMTAEPITATDALGRPLRDLRISVTDRCNFRCSYCMPKEIFGAGYRFMHRKELLSFEEIARFCRIMVGMGVKKIRLTGGEPLLRHGLEMLVEMLAGIEGLADLSLTTNGSLLSESRAKALKAAGLKRVTVSLDALDDNIFMAINDVSFPAAKVIQAIDCATRAGLGPVKINMVVKRGVNEQEILPMARRFKGSGHIVRFIEFMDVGSTNGWRLDDVLPARDIVAMIHREMPLEPVSPNYHGEVAGRWRYCDGSGEIGVITSVTQPFCDTCSRLRLSAEGKLYTCLFAQTGRDFRELLRGGASDESVASVIGGIWAHRQDRYSEMRSAETAALPKVEMSYIGG